MTIIGKDCSSFKIPEVIVTKDQSKIETIKKIVIQAEIQLEFPLTIEVSC